MSSSSPYIDQRPERAAVAARPRTATLLVCGYRRLARLRSVLVIGISTALCACGGGGDSGPAPITGDQVAIQGKVTDQGGAGVGGAEIGLMVGEGIYKAQTDDSGKFDLRVPASSAANLAYPTVYVNKAGHRPTALVYQSFAAGQAYAGSTSLPLLATNESVPELGYLVHHLGNDVYGGAQNSQFQRSTEGTSITMKLDDFDAKLAQGYRNATVSLLHKGVQATCVDHIILFQASSAGVIGANTMAQIRPSPADGSYGNDSYVFSLSGFIAGQTTFLALRSTLSCPSGLSDGYDDFEFTNVLVTFG